MGELQRSQAAVKAFITADVDEIEGVDLDKPVEALLFVSGGQDFAGAGSKKGMQVSGAQVSFSLMQDGKELEVKGLTANPIQLTVPVADPNLTLSLTLTLALALALAPALAPPLLRGRRICISLYLPHISPGGAADGARALRAAAPLRRLLHTHRPGTALLEPPTPTPTLYPYPYPLTRRCEPLGALLPSRDRGRL